MAALSVMPASTFGGDDPIELYIDKSEISGLLSQQTIRQTFQDSNGYLWLLTQDGLYKYDGYKIRHFLSAADGDSRISHTNVRQILEDRDGVIWIAAIGGGLSYYEPDKNRFTPLEVNDNKRPSRRYKNITTLKSDEKGSIWVGLRSGHIGLLNPQLGSINSLNHPDLSASKNGKIVEFEHDDLGFLWIATSKRGLIRYGHGASDPEVLDLGSNVVITSLEIDDQRRIWVGTRGNGVLVLDQTGKRLFDLKHSGDEKVSISSNVVNTIFLDRSKNVWIGTDKGLDLFNEEHGVTRYNGSNSGLSDELVLSIFQDSSDRYWIGTHFGLYTAVISNFQTYNSLNGLTGETITSFTQSEDEEIWIGSYQGVFSLSPEGLINSYKGSNAPIMTIASKDNELWLGVRNLGLYRAPVKNPIASKLSANLWSVSDLHADSTGELWAASYGNGLHRLDENSNTRVGMGRQNNGNSEPYLLTIYETTQGSLLIGGAEGLSKLNKSANLLEPIPSLTSGLNVDNSTVLALSSDNHSNIWLGLQYEGLALWKAEDMAAGRNIFHKVETVPPMPSSTVYAIEKDDNGMLWLSTTDGLVRLDPDTHKIVTFNYSDGLQDNEFNAGASFKDSRGRLYFGGNRGFNRFHPDEIVIDTRPPPIKLTQVVVAGIPLEFDVSHLGLDSLDLGYQDYYVSFEFSALDYREPTKNRYKYKLENFDPDWVDIGTRHNATFTNLPSGKYRLHITGANSKGIWNHQGLVVNLNVYPPYWLTWWAFFLYGAALIVVLLFIKKYYDNYAEKERAHSVASSMSITAEQAMDDLQEQFFAERALVKNIQDHTNNTLDIVSDMLQRHACAIDDESILELFHDNQQRFHCLKLIEKHLFYSADLLEVNFHGFIESLFADMEPQCHRNGLEIVPINDTLQIRLPAEVAIPAALVCNELINNSLSHAFYDSHGVHTIKVHLGEIDSRGSWLLEISDSGCGLPDSIDPKHPATLGLELVQHYVKQMGASMELERSPATLFRVIISKPSVAGSPVA